MPDDPHQQQRIDVPAGQDDNHRPGQVVVIGEHRCDPGCAGGFHDQFRALGEKQQGLGDLFLADRPHLHAEPRQDLERDHAGGRHGDAVGHGRDLGGDRVPGLQ